MMEIRASDARGVVEKARVEGRTWREARRAVNIFAIVDDGSQWEEELGCFGGVEVGD